MRLDHFDLNLLVALDALLEERNVTRASQRLHISQSGASAALNRLRSHFSDELLVPVGRQLTLTPLAQELIQPVRDALLQVRAAISRQPTFDPSQAERHFEVYASDYLTTVFLARAVQHLAVQAPRLTLEIRTPPKDALEAFDRGVVDLLVIPQQYAQRLPHPQAPLFEDTQTCMVCAANRDLEEPLSFDDYMKLGHVAVRFGDERSVSFEDWFLPRYGRQRRVECSVDNFSTLPLLVIGTRRIATLHQRLARHFERIMPVRLVAPPFDMPPLIETMVWPRHVNNDPAHLWLREQLLQLAQQLPPECALEFGASL